MNRAKYILKFLILVICRPAELWEYLSRPEVDESSPDYVQRSYFLPLLGVMSLVVFLCEGFHCATDAVFDLQQGMLHMVPLLVAYFVGPYIAIFLLRELLVNFYGNEHPSKVRLNLFVFYSTSFLIAHEMVMALMPSIRFFWFIACYTWGITWSGSGTFIRVGDHHRWIFSFISALVIYFSSHFVISLLQHMQG